MPNQSDQNQLTNTPVINPVVDLPPLPTETPSQSPAVAPTSNQSTAPQSGSQPSDAPTPPPQSPSVIATKPKKKFGGGKIIATILGVLLLLGGVGAGIYLTQQQQLFQQKAQEAGCSCPDGTGASCNTNCNTGDVVGDQIYCATCGPNGGPTICASGYAPNSNNTACESTTTTTDGGGSVCIGCVNNVGEQQGMHNVTDLKVTLTSPTSASLTWNYSSGRACTKRGGTYIFIGTDKSVVDNNCNLPGGSFWEINTALPSGCNWLKGVDGGATSFDTASNGITLEPNTNYYYKVVSRYFHTQTFPNHPGEEEDEGEWCGGQTYSPPTTTGQCLSVKAYNTNWSEIPTADLSKLKAGDSVNFCVAGSGGTFDKAQFWVTGVAQAITTTKGQGLAANSFCQSVGITDQTTNVDIKAKIHDSVNDTWVGETF